MKRNKDFQAFVALLAETVSRAGGKTSRDVSVAEVLTFQPPAAHHSAEGSEVKNYKTVEEALGDVVSSIRETIVIRRAAVVAQTAPGAVLATYMHNKVGGVANPNTQLGKIASIAVLRSNPGLDASSAHYQTLQQETGRKLAMHIVAAQPLFLDAKDATSEFVEAEKAIYQEQMKDEKKPADVLQKIIDGKVNKRLAEVSLLQQNHQAEDNNPVVHKFFDDLSKSMQSKISIESFSLWSLNQ